MKTGGQDGWFVYFPLYAPTGPFFDRSWAFPDFEHVTLDQVAPRSLTGLVVWPAAPPRRNGSEPMA